MTRLTWLGHSGFLIESRGGAVAVDPWLKAPTFSGTDLSGVGTVLVSHGHFDHAESAPDVCRQSGATLLCIHEVSFWAAEQGVPSEQVVGMNIGGTVERDGWRFTMVPAMHSGGCPGDGGHGHAIVPGGAAAGWIIGCPDGEVVYHAGDTTVFGDMALIARLYRPTVALLPIGGHYTMGPREAGLAAELLDVSQVVPMHYGTFPALAGTPEELRRHCPDGVRVERLEPGAALDLAG